MISLDKRDRGGYVYANALGPYEDMTATGVDKAV